MNTEDQNEPAVADAASTDQQTNPSDSWTPETLFAESASPALGSSSQPATSNTGDVSAPEAPSGQGTTPDQRGAEGVAPKAPPVAPRDEPAKVENQQKDVSLTPEKIAEIAARAAAATSQQQNQQVRQTQQQPQSVDPKVQEEQFNKAFQIPKIDNKTYQDIFGTPPDRPEQVQALNNFTQGILRSAGLMTQFMLDQARQSVESRINPLIEQSQIQRNAEVEKQFFAEYPHLSDFKPLLQNIVEQAKASGKTFPSVAEVNKYVAEQASALLGKAMPQKNAQVQQQTGVRPQQNVVKRQMTPTSVGGQVTGASGSATVGNDAQRIFS